MLGTIHASFHDSDEVGGASPAIHQQPQQLVYMRSTVNVGMTLGMALSCWRQEFQRAFVSSKRRPWQQIAEAAFQEGQSVTSAHA